MINNDPKSIQNRYIGQINMVEYLTDFTLQKVGQKDPKKNISIPIGYFYNRAFVYHRLYDA